MTSRIVALLASIGAVSIGALALGTSASALHSRGHTSATASNRRAAVGRIGRSGVVSAA